MALSVGLDIATSGLAVAASQTAVASRNITRAGEIGASRKILGLVTQIGGGTRLGAVTRATDTALHDRLLDATSAAARRDAVVAALDRLDIVAGDVTTEGSIAAYGARLRDDLQLFASAPGDAVRAQAAVRAALGLARGLNEAAAGVQAARTAADGEIAASVARINTALAEFGSLNDAIVRGTRADADITDELDARDAVLARLAEEIGIRTLHRAGNDVAIYTQGGGTLFAGVPRAVSFTATQAFSAATAGNAVLVDGVPAIGAGAVMPVASGRLAALVEVRDGIGETMQAQLDEVARGLIALFAESDVSALGTGPAAAGLFTYAGAPAVPSAGVRVVGLAGEIAVAARADPARGGDAFRLRDGGISNAGNPAYVANPGGAAGYATRLIALARGFGTAQPFDAGAGLTTEAGVLDYAAASAGWLGALRQSAASEATRATTQQQRATEAWSNKTGINLDDEMARLLELERSYAASAKLIASIDQMYAALLQAVG